MATFNLPPEKKKIVPLNDEIMDYIKEKTGAVGIFLMITDTSYPCPDSRAGERCAGGHQMFVAFNDIDPIYIPQIIAQQTGVRDFPMPDDTDWDNHEPPHPYGS